MRAGLPGTCAALLIVGIAAHRSSVATDHAVPQAGAQTARARAYAASEPARATREPHSLDATRQALWHAALEAAHARTHADAPAVLDPEDLAMAAHERSPEQRQLRRSWRRQATDEAWTRETLRWFDDAARQRGLAGPITVSQASCRASVCRLYVQFEDELDAQAFIAGPTAPGVRHVYQSLDPDYDGAGFDDSEYSYEVLIERTLPPGTPTESPEQPEAGLAVLSDPHDEVGP